MTAAPQAEPMPLLEQALQLTAAARALATGQEAQQAEQKTRTNLNELNNALTAMAESAKAVRRAAHHGVTVPHTKWDAGWRNLAEHARRGRPSPQALLSAAKVVKATTATANEQLKASWAAWAAAQLADPLLQRIPLLPAADRATNEQHLARLRALAGSKAPPKAYEVDEFVRLLAGLKEALQDVTDDDNLTALVTRLAATGGVRLSDVSDAELAALRKHPELPAQIWLTRR